MMLGIVDDGLFSVAELFDNGPISLVTYCITFDLHWGLMSREGKIDGQGNRRRYN